MFEKKRSIRVENVKNQIGNGNIPHKFGADFFPAKALLQDAERQWEGEI